MKESRQNTKGITLISLVVTIIVLLILAGVSISVLTGENGIINRTTEAKTTSKIAEIEEQANLEYTAMLIDQLSGKTSDNVALANVCKKLKNDYKLPVELITTNAPTVDKVRFTSSNVTKSNDDGTVGTISIAQGTESTIIEAEAVVTQATGSWYAVVEGKHYKIEIPTGQSKIKIAREESNVNGGNNTPTVTYAVTSLNPSDSGVTVDSSSGAIKVPNSATGTAVITATAGGQSATCTVTIIQKISSITATVGNEGTVAAGEKVGITVIPNPPTNVEAVTYSYSIPQASQSIATVNETTGEITGVAEGGPVTITVTGTGNLSGTQVSTDCTVTVTAPAPSPYIDSFYVQYNVAYTDVFTGTPYDQNTGWRLITKIENDTSHYNAQAGTYEGNIDIISTGIPAKLYYDKSTIPNFEKSGTTKGLWAGDSTDRSNYVSAFYGTAGNNNVYAASGLFYNFGNIVYKVTGTTDTLNKDSGGVLENKQNYGGYIAISKNESPVAAGDTTTGDDLFKISNLASGTATIRSVSYKDINGLGTSDDTTTITGQNDVRAGLFRLQGYTPDEHSTGTYWLASPHGSYGNNLRVVIFDGNISYSGSGAGGVRPVVSITGVKLKKNGNVWQIVSSFN